MAAAGASLAGACVFPAYDFDDARYEKRATGGTAGEGGTAGTTSNPAGAGFYEGSSGFEGTAGSSDGTNAGSSGSRSTEGSDGSDGRAGSGDAGTRGGDGTSGTSGSGGTNAGSGGTGGAGAGGAGGAGAGGAPNGKCKHSADCVKGQECSFAGPSGLFCQDENSGGVQIGGDCNDGTGMPNDASCESNYCEPLSLSCTTFCSSDSDCESNPCATITFTSGAKYNECLPACLSNADCIALSDICTLGHDVDGNSLSLFCLTAGSSAGFGTPPEDGLYCNSGVAYDNLCTQPCKTSKDCAAPLPTCASKQFTDTNGTKQDFNVCTDLRKTRAS